MSYEPSCLDTVQALVPYRDLSRVLIHPVVLEDACLYQQFVCTLSDEARRNRFHATLRELPPDLLRTLTNVDQINHVALVAKALDKTGEIIVGEARFVREEEGNRAEFAIAVAESWRGKGVGVLLFHQLELSARRMGVDEMFGLAYAENEAIIRLASCLGFRVDAGDITCGVLELCKRIDRRCYGFGSGSEPHVAG